MLHQPIVLCLSLGAIYVPNPTQQTSQIWPRAPVMMSSALRMTNGAPTMSSSTGAVPVGRPNSVADATRRALECPPPRFDDKPRAMRVRRLLVAPINGHETSGSQQLSTVSVDKAVELRTQIAGAPTWSQATRGLPGQKQSMTRTSSPAVPQATAFHGNSDLHQQNAPHGKTIGPD